MDPEARVEDVMRMSKPRLNWGELPVVMSLLSIHWTGVAEWVRVRVASTTAR